MLRALIRRVPIFIVLVVLLGSAGVAASGSKPEPETSREDKNDEALQAYNSGVDHMQKGDDIAARGDSAFAYNYRATSEAKARKEYEKAVASYQLAVKLNPGLKEAYNNLGYSYRKLGELDKSLESYKKAIELDSTFAQAREYLGETYLAMGDVYNAREQLGILEQMQSPLADTLLQSIKLYQLREVNKQIESAPGD